MTINQDVIIFNKSDGSLWYTGTMTPSNFNTDKHVIATMPEGEAMELDTYQYSLVDGVITKGEKWDLNLPEE